MRAVYFLLFMVITFACLGNSPIKPVYSVPKSRWPESFGNHRAVLQISGATDIVGLDLVWRRHGTGTAKKRFLIVSAETGDTIPNIYRLEVNNERCRILFGPVIKPGTYYFYYLPYEVQKNYGNYSKDYLKPEDAPSLEWKNKNLVSTGSKVTSFPQLNVIGIESRSPFDSFFPMEVVPIVPEKKGFLARFKSDYLVFPEDRAFPIRMKDEIPLRWVEKGPSGNFHGEACKNEYYAFQIGVFASKKELKNVKVEFSSLAGSTFKIPVSALTCFNTGGIGPYGEPFEKRIDMEQGDVQPLWIGIDIPREIPAGIYSGIIKIVAENSISQSVAVSLKISEKVLPDRGDSEPWRHSRLRWLNSTRGIDDQPTRPYDPIEFLGNSTYRLTDKILMMDKSGMPGSIKVSETELLANPLSFAVETKNGNEVFTLPQDVKLLKNQPGAMSGGWNSSSANFRISGVGVIESDGYINYKIHLEALNDVRINDIRLEIPVRNEVAEYMMGMGLPGSAVPQSLDAKWKGPHDSFWIGNTHAGIWCELRGGTYNGPLLNLYHPAPPESWYNRDNGGFRIEKSAAQTKAVVYSGKRELKTGENLDFEWSLLMTPVNKINTQSQFTDRYYHNGGNPMPTDDDLSCGVKVVNLHHANNFNPHINYPFIAVDSMKWFVKQLHAKGKKVKIYYTIRELTNYTTEIWALRSLGYEILGEGKGGGYPWLREHLIDGYRPQWYQYFPDKSADASIVNAPGDSRWYNYYIEGLAWLVRNVDIDGLYLDDVSYDRRTVKRIRKVLDHEKPGCLLDLHSNTGFSIGPANQYAEYFPYIDKLWFGESFQYDQMAAENWLVEVSGIPFGLMGDMLQGGGNRWRGMVYGMTVRHPWTTEGLKCDPRPVWKIWDEFGIESSTMKGYWEKDCPVTTAESGIHATVYQKADASLISVASWNDKPVKFLFRFDWKTLGIDPAKAVLVAPEIKDFQNYATFNPNDSIPIEPKKGWLMYLREKK